MPIEHVTKRLVLFDVDGTLMSGHTQTVFFRLLNQQGIMTWDVLLRVTVWFIAYKLYLADDPTQIYRQAYAALAHRKLSDIERLIQENFSRFQKKVFPEAYRCLRDHRQQGDKTVALSASTEPVVQSICRELGIDDCIATKLQLDGETFTGNIEGHAMYGSQKTRAYRNYLQRSTSTYTQTVFYADHISDLELLELVDLPICVNPDVRLKNIAQARQWTILRWGKKG
ncbi:MAG: HAD-IB family hydrolase [Phycisphaerae bacterium]|nr:HAD-IB family hydrolase [Phycisphaerae bacterium]